MSQDDRGAPYQHRLELLASGAVEELVAGWAAEHQGASAGEWRRIYGKLRPQRPTWALLVYQADDGTTVAVRMHEPDLPLRDGFLAAGDLGVAEVVPCATDPALPGLRAVLGALEASRVVRYHPGNRCIVHGGRGPDARYVKVFSTEVDDQKEAMDRWTAATSGRLSFAVAEPHGWDPETRSSWYGVVPGLPLEPALARSSGLELVRRVGTAVGELAVAPLDPGDTDDDAHQLKRTRRSLERAAVAVPSMRAELDRASELLGRAHSCLGPRPLVPIHGAAHLGQWLVDDTGRLGLVDFDRFAWGEPEFDLATFLVEAGAAARSVPVEELRAAVLDGFRDVAGPVDDQRLQLYLMHKRLSRIVRAAAGLRPDGPDRAVRELAGVMEDLRTLA
jgi:hypothetical protein